MSIVEIGINVCNQFNDFDYYCLHILQQVIYGGKPSRLFSELREKHGLTYRSGSYINLYETCGIFVLYAISDSGSLMYSPTKHKGVVPVMFDILEDIVKNGITDSEFKLAKQFIKESLKMQSIASGEKSVYNGLRLMLHNDTSIMTNANMYDKCYKHITKHDIHKIIEKYFAGRKYFMSISGDNLPKQSKFAGFLLPQ
jgi:predicted Zn-dependent peptidase